MTFTTANKYISEFEINIKTGEILGVGCRNHNDNSYSYKGRTEGILSSGYFPISEDWTWKLNVDQPAFIAEGSRLIMANRENKQPIGFIEFSGYKLNPYDVQIIIQDDFLVIYLDDSNQFFVFQIK